MNSHHLKTICTHFNLGIPQEPPQRVYGGLLHTMWQISTNRGRYAIKQLSKDIDLSNQRIIENYESSELVASRFLEQGIPAICAIEKAGKYLFIIEETGFLIYPWVNAQALDQHAISENHALQIAKILAKMHALTLDEPNIPQLTFCTTSKEEVLALIEKAEFFDCPFAAALRGNQSNILAALKAYQNAIPTLVSQLVVSHGDLDQKNVLWDRNNHPILIDWESACKINPTYDIVNTAFYWSGITTHFDQALFFKMIHTYQNTGGTINPDHVEAACYGTFNWIGWMIYNIERSCVNAPPEQKTLGIEQVDQTLATLLRLQTVIPRLIKTIKNFYKQHE